MSAILPTPSDPPAEDPGSAGPSDLGTGEHDVASWLGGLDRAPPPTDLGNRMVGSWIPPAVHRVGRMPATVAALTVAGAVLAITVLFSVVARDAGEDAQAQSRPVPPPAHVVDDPNVHHYRDLETFRHLDLVAPGEADLLADGDGR